jgi:hypothetical protein
MFDIQCPLSSASLAHRRTSRQASPRSSQRSLSALLLSSLSALSLSSLSVSRFIRCCSLPRALSLAHVQYQHLTARRLPTREISVKSLWLTRLCVCIYMCVCVCVRENVHVHVHVHKEADFHIFHILNRYLAMNLTVLYCKSILYISIYYIHVYLIIINLLYRLSRLPRTQRRPLMSSTAR